jgi:hypothetical protein
MEIKAELQNLPSDRTRWNQLCRETILKLGVLEVKPNTCLLVGNAQTGFFDVQVNHVAVPAAITCYNFENPACIREPTGSTVVRRRLFGTCFGMPAFEALAANIFSGRVNSQYYSVQRVADLTKPFVNGRAVSVEDMRALVPLLLPNRRAPFDVFERLGYREGLQFQGVVDPKPDPFQINGHAFRRLYSRAQSMARRDPTSGMADDSFLTKPFEVDELDGLQGLKPPNPTRGYSVLDHIVHEGGYDSNFMSATADFARNMMLGVEGSLKRYAFDLVKFTTAQPVYVAWFSLENVNYVDMTNKQTAVSKIEESMQIKRRNNPNRDRGQDNFSMAKCYYYAWMWSEILITNRVEPQNFYLSYKFLAINATHVNVSVVPGPLYAETGLERPVQL